MNAINESYKLMVFLKDKIMFSKYKLSQIKKKYIFCLCLKNILLPIFFNLLVVAFFVVLLLIDLKPMPIAIPLPLSVLALFCVVESKNTMIFI